jgi:hypothetical protein
MNFKIEENCCNCHPETCCCDDWIVVDDNGDKIATFYNKEDAENLIRIFKSRNISNKFELPSFNSVLDELYSKYENKRARAIDVYRAIQKLGYNNETNN